MSGEGRAVSSTAGDALAAFAMADGNSAEKGQTIVIFSALYLPHMGGVETYTAGLAHELATRGNRVIVATSRLSEGDLVHERQSDGVEVMRFPCRALLGGRLPVPVHDGAHRALMEQLAAAHPTRVVVNTRFYGHSHDGAKFAAEQGIPAVVIEHGSAHLSLGNAIADAAIQRYEHAVTERMKSFGFPFAGVSRAACDWLGHFGIEAVGVVPNALDAQEYACMAASRDFRGELNVGEGDVLVASVGRLVPEKGIGELLEAARIVAEHAEGRSVVFAVAGDGTLLADVQEAGGNVVALGRLDAPNVAALLRDADVYLLPSRSEGFATTLLEACAMGAFPVTTDVGGAEELGIGRVGGIVLPDASAASIVAALQVVAGERDECARQAHVLHRRVIQQGGWAASADALERVFADEATACWPAKGATGKPAKPPATAEAIETVDADDAPFEGDERLDQLHRVLLMMMKDFAAICERENITWLAHYGTAIGALRHGGFIPWDDDIDICMLRPDLERFEKAVQDDPSGKYFIVNAQTHAGYPLATTRFVLAGTEFRDSALATMDFPSGIFLDLFPLDVLADDEGARNRQIVGAWFFNKLATAKLTENPYIVAKGMKAQVMSLAARTAHGVLNLPGIREADPNDVSRHFLTLHEGEKTQHVGYLCDTMPWDCIYELDGILPVRWVPFEDMMIPVPNKVEEQLTAFYGDWMTPPPGNERKAHYPDILDFGPYAAI